MLPWQELEPLGSIPRYEALDYLASSFRTRYQHWIGPRGPIDAEYAVVAQKPGKDEHISLLRGQPEILIGPTGKATERHLVQARIPLNSVYLTNVIKAYDDYSTTPTPEEVAEQLHYLLYELSSLPRLRGIIALGAHALFALSGLKQMDIGARRGSLLQSVITIPFLPTYHPSFYMRSKSEKAGPTQGNWSMRPIVDFDFRRAKYYFSKPFSNPQRVFGIQPTFQEAITWLEEALTWDVVSYDTEITRSRNISCIGFSNRPDYAFCIPFLYNTGKPYWSEEEEATIWLAIARIFANPNCLFVAQNGLFDMRHLWKHGVNIHYPLHHSFDTMYSHRYLMAGMPHGLDFITSTYTEEPYYKDESGDWKSPIKVPNEQFWMYNCKDCAVTVESSPEIFTDMVNSKQIEYYRDVVHPQLPICMDMWQRGMRVSRPKLDSIRQEIFHDLISQQERVKAILGWLPNTRSPKDMPKLFAELGIKVKRTKKGNVKADEESLAYYAHDFPEHREILQLCRAMTKNRTLLSNFTEMALDKDDFYHCEIDPYGTKTGRAAGRGSDAGGPQPQNIPKRMRKIFVPDTDQDELTNADLKQAEKMLVVWDAQDPLFLRAFEEKKDVHRVMGCLIYRNWQSLDILPPDDLLASIRKVCDTCALKGEEECNHAERYMSKQSGHAFSYLQGWLRFIREQAKKDIFIEAAEAKRIRKLAITPAIAAWQELGLEKLKQSRWQENPLGTRREFYGLIDNDMLREYLSWWAQSTVGAITSMAMIRLYKTLPQFGARLITQTHDSTTVNGPIKYREEIRQCLRDAFNIPMVIHGRPLTIPLDITSGPSWGEQH